MFPDDYDQSRENVWAGLRPVTPDDVPVIGQSSKYKNLYFNFGQGSRGMKFSLGSAILLRDLMTHSPPSIDPNPFRPS